MTCQDTIMQPSLVSATGGKSSRSNPDEEEDDPLMSMPLISFPGSSQDHNEVANYNDNDNNKELTATVTVTALGIIDSDNTPTPFPERQPIRLPLFVNNPQQQHEQQQKQKQQPQQPQTESLVQRNQQEPVVENSLHTHTHTHAITNTHTPTSVIAMPLPPSKEPLHPPQSLPNDGNNNNKGVFYNNDAFITEQFRLRQLEQQVLAAIRQLDKTDRRAFGLAMDIVPALVQQETPLVHFLRTENYHPDRAARRVALYWKFRHQLFGERRWLLPMTQTGTGALTKRDVQLLHSGYGYFRNRTGDGLLIVSNASRFPADFCPLVHARLTLYVATVLTDIPSQTIGATVVYVAQSLPATNNSGSGSNNNNNNNSSRSTGGGVPTNTDPTAWNVVNLAAPLRVKELIVATAFVPGKEGILNYLAYQEARVNEFRSGRNTHQIVGQSLKHTLSLLEARGLHRDHLPACLGGNYQYTELNEWIRQRISMEDVLSSAPVRVSNNCFFVSWDSIQVLDEEEEDNNNHYDSNMQRALVTTKTTPNTRNASKRRHSGQSKSKSKSEKIVITTATGGNSTKVKQLNALYSRRAYHRRKLERLAMQEKVDELKQHQETLRKETKRLEYLLETARQIIQQQRV